MNKIAILTNSFKLGSPVQQLTDRFLIGFTRDGVFEPAPRGRVTIWCHEQSDLIAKRVSDYGLKVASSPSDALLDAEAVLTFDKIEVPRTGGRVFAYGDFNSPHPSGTVASTLGELPALDLPSGAKLRQSMVITHRDPLFATEAIMAIQERTREGIREIPHLGRWEGDSIWASTAWSRRAFAAAISRSDKIQGETLADGRTEDIVAHDLVSRMAKSPVAWLLHHDNGSVTHVFILEGVVEDILAGFETRKGELYSTQLFQSPPPAEEHYSRLAVVLSDYFQTGKAPWSPKRSKLLAYLEPRFAR